MAPSSCVSLKVRQQPQSALVTLDGKEKCTSPVLKVSAQPIKLILDQHENPLILLLS